jgi:hypothetical protein
VNKKTEKRLKTGIAFAVSRFDDNAYRRFFRVGNADDNFRDLARWTAGFIRRSSLPLKLLPPRTRVSRKLRIPRIIVCHKYTKLGTAIYRKGMRKFRRKEYQKTALSSDFLKFFCTFLSVSYLLLIATTRLSWILVAELFSIISVSVLSNVVESSQFSTISLTNCIRNN